MLIISSKVLELTVCCMRKLHADYISRSIIAPDVKPFPKKSAGWELGTIINHFLLLFHLLLYFRYVVPKSLKCLRNILVAWIIFNALDVYQMVIMIFYSTVWEFL